MNNKKSSIVKFAASVSIVLMLLYALNKFNVIKGFGPEEIKNYVDSFGPLAPVVFIILFTLVPLTFFPDSILAIAGGLIFGIYKGFLLIMVGALCGATLSFCIARFLGKGVIAKLVKHDISKFERQLEKNAFLIILLLRFIPLFPFDVISYGAGLSKIKFKNFIAATMVGTIPGIFAYANLGAQSAHVGSRGFYISIVIIVALFAVAAFVKNNFLSGRFESTPE
ncbi:Uncharacterized membrane protein YdjX, TVP38/TMEM64 family, SNARE-associated domain [Peptoclostridium litorale DSM 5388]|uniref:TVP38/TMEM64 family membrane protein n=1 Tax=Peptoclostridium litorale DSM 5388 TaxID=1121324 RepID=A0A069RBY1_PEPLI|nr:TVP38/TMEM64 family protein [Peptoclostridium litorale]KDR93755.1 SNARE-like domain-containing protein [Peptoclostridium litorale DSM 5388]SIN85220.1 Uncharacterized membrane protein YdjX, TVP38/TMEM64 family, SNARE-associated domain [Peptoclostridium litorale DSM 5388]